MCRDIARTAVSSGLIALLRKEKLHRILLRSFLDQAIAHNNKTFGGYINEMGNTSLQ